MAKVNNDESVNNVPL